MLTDFNFLQPGEDWPPEAEQGRLDTYEANRKLWQGRHDEVFSQQAWRLIREDQAATLELVLNWNRRLTKLFSDLLIGEPPRFSAADKDSPEQKALDRLVENNELPLVGYEAAIDVSRYGDGLFKARLKEGEAVIESQPTTTWFPVVSPDNIRSMQGHVLAWTLEDPQDRNQRLLRAEIHAPGRIENRLYRLDSGRLREPMDLSRIGVERVEVEATGVSESLVVPVNGLRASDEIHGADDYSDIESLVAEIEVRFAQISRILDRHADPNLAGPEDAIERNPITGQESFRGGGKYFPLGPDDPKPEYVTWEGQLEAAFRQIEDLMKQLYSISETSSAAFGQLEQGLAESGSALKRLLIAPLAKVNRIRLRFDPALKKVLRVAAELERTNGGDTPPLEDIQIEWRDGLPEDPAEETQIEAQRVAARLSARASAIARLDDSSEEVAQEEVDRINEEGAAEAGASAGGGRELDLFGERAATNGSRQ